MIKLPARRRNQVNAEQRPEIGIRESSNTVPTVTVNCFLKPCTCRPTCTAAGRLRVACRAQTATVGARRIAPAHFFQQGAGASKLMASPVSRFKVPSMEMLLDRCVRVQFNTGTTS